MEPYVMMISSQIPVNRHTDNFIQSLLINVESATEQQKTKNDSLIITFLCLVSSKLKHHTT